jgi:hypothetical protein
MKYCHQCGKPCPDDSKFCGFCGYRFETPVQVAYSQVPPAGQYPTSRPNPSPENLRSPVSFSPRTYPPVYSGEPYQDNLWSKVQGLSDRNKIILGACVLLVICCICGASVLGAQTVATNFMPTSTPTPTQTFTPTNTPLPTPTYTPTPTHTLTPTLQPTKTEEPTLIPTHEQEQPDMLNTQYPVNVEVTPTKKASSKYGPSGSTGQCADGTYTYSAKKGGACAKNGGISDWWGN